MPPTPIAALPSQVAPPEISLTAALPHAATGTEVAAVAVLPATDGSESLAVGPGAAELAERLDLDLLGILDLSSATGKAGEVWTVPVPGGSPDNPDLRRVLLVGVGDQTSDDLRRAGAALGRATCGLSSVASTVQAVAGDRGLEAFVAGAVLGSFTFSWRAGEPERRPVPRLLLAGVADVSRTQPVLDRALATARAAWRARLLATVPSNVKNPAWLAAQAETIAAESGLEVTVWDEERLSAEGFGGLVGVGQASATPPRLIRLDYSPARSSRRTPTVALVGKGITFDSGGLSIKPGEAMVNMKRDMTGGAVVMATMAALAAVDCPVRVVGLVAAAENAVSGNALRPGDVLRHYGGRTSEVTNTDAEGRLVLADALAYAVATLKPAAIVDVATLTGAIKVALGQQVGGFFSNHDGLAEALDAAGRGAGEPLWRMPLADAYEPKLSSSVADADNAPGGPGAIVAALFLQHFVGDVPWAHLDIASVGDSPDERHEWTKGPTGFGTRALLHWLGSPEPLQGVGA